MPPVAAAEGSPRRPIAVIVSGRGKTGKSLFAWWLAGTSTGQAPLKIVDADPKNQSLANRCSSAEVPPGLGDDRRYWIEAQFDRLIADAGTPKQHDLLLDLGGGDLFLRRWGHEIDLASMLIDEGVDPVLVHMLGPDEADVSHLADVETGGIFAPPRTVVVLNAGLVPPNRSVATAFEKVLTCSAVQSVLGRGGKLVHMPALLDCMAEFESSGLPFDQVGGALARNALGAINNRRVSRWLRQDMPAFRAAFGDWLPE
jgi:hypothetical protein